MPATERQSIHAPEVAQFLEVSMSIFRRFVAGDRRNRATTAGEQWLLWLPAWAAALVGYGLKDRARPELDDVLGQGLLVEGDVASGEGRVLRFQTRKIEQPCVGQVGWRHVL